MCGLAGIFSYKDSASPVDVDELRKINDYMIKRGPDGEGLWLSEDRRIGLAHRRLSIIDLSERGAQPMMDPSSGAVITYNGEIYNYRELRERLASQGCEFRSESDTEVLLHLYREKGQDMLADLRGMFAFAIWEPHERRLFCARDPYGIKPLYYCDDGRNLRFASQVKALLAGGNVSREVSAAGKAGFYLWGSVPEPWTWFQGIHVLPAGHSLSVSEGGKVSADAYDHLADAWNEDPREDDPSIAESLKASVAAHLVADVPVGLFLSGGVDSCALLAIIRERGIKSLQCITLGFDEFRELSEDETVLAAEIARRYDADHYIVRYTPEHIEQLLPRFFAAMDQPSIDGLNTWLVSRAARERGLKVAMSGLGGDELLGGYPSFTDIPKWVRQWSRLQFLAAPGNRLSRVMNALSRLPIPPKALGLPVLGGDWASAYLLRRGVFMPWELEQVMGGEQAAEGLRALHPIQLIERALADLNMASARERTRDFARVALLESSFYLRNQLLRDADWASMDSSVEIRTPLVDRPLLSQVAGRISSSQETKSRPDKTVLASTPDTALPPRFTERPKTGFTLPMNRWLQIPTLKDLWSDQPMLKHSRCHWSRRWLHTVAQAYELS